MYPNKDMEQDPLKGCTQEEISKLTKAMKTQQFGAHMDEYIQEISDPKHKKEYVQYLEQLEAKGEMPDGQQLLRAEPGCCVKTTIRFKNGQDQKCFINIVHSAQIEDMKFEVDKTKGGTSVNLPYSLSPPRPDQDNKGRYCMTCDMAVSTGTFLRCQQPEFLNMVVDTATQGLTGTFLKGHEEVKKDYKVLTNVKCKGGTPMPMSVKSDLMKDKGKGVKKAKRKVGKDDIVTPSELKEMRKDAKAKKDREMEALAHESEEEDSEDERRERERKRREEEEEKSTRIRVPKHKLVHVGTIDLTDFMESETRPMQVRNLPKILRLEIELPTVKRIEAINLEVTCQNVVVEVAGKYYLDLPLSYEIDDAKGCAKFDKDKQVLTLTLPVVPKIVEGALEGLVDEVASYEDDDGGISDHEGSEDADLPPLEEEAAEKKEDGKGEGGLTEAPGGVADGNAASEKSAEEEKSATPVQRASLDDNDFVQDGNLKMVELAQELGGDTLPEAAVSNADLEPFMASDFFDGKRAGYYFGRGEQGLGYYTDRRQGKRLMETKSKPSGSGDVLFRPRDVSDRAAPAQSASASESMVVEVFDRAEETKASLAVPVDRRSTWPEELRLAAEEAELMRLKVQSKESEVATEEPCVKWSENVANLILTFELPAGESVADVRLDLAGFHLRISFCTRPDEDSSWIRRTCRRVLRRSIDVRQWHAEVRRHDLTRVVMVIRKVDKEIWGDVFDTHVACDPWVQIDKEAEASAVSSTEVSSDDSAPAQPSVALDDSAELDIAAPVPMSTSVEPSAKGQSSLVAQAHGVVPGGNAAAAAAAATAALQSAAVMGMAVPLKNKLIYSLM